MKKFFLLTVFIMITTVGFSYEYSYESVRCFSDREIANLLPIIAKANPHIPNLNWIYPGEILNVPLDDALISIFIKEGDNTSKILSLGIPVIRIAEAKFIHASTKSDIIETPTNTVTKVRQPIPTYIWWDILGICSLFIVLAFVYIRLKKVSR